MIPRCSIIIPALNEAQTISQTLLALAPYRAAGCELIVVDGGSVDNTLSIALPLADICIEATAGRAQQMNAGAARANAGLLWFLHADTYPEGYDSADIELVLNNMQNTVSAWGFFPLRLRGNERWCRVLEFFINQRSSLSGIGTGDQGIFLSKTVFDSLGGFARLQLMEDVELCKQLKRVGRPGVLSRWPLETSSRRWRKLGVMKTIGLMWKLRLAFFLGVNHRRIAKLYR